MKSKIYLTGTLIGISMALNACQSESSEAKAITTKSLSRPITTVESSEFTELRTSPGRVASIEQVQVASRMMGFVTQVLVSEGQRVQKGQVLFRIDPIDIDGQVAMAGAGGSQAKALLADAKSDFERFDRLYKDSAITKAQWEKMKLNLEIAVERVRGADAGLRMASAQKRYTDVVAPISGIVSQKMIQAGNLALPGHPLIMLENPEKLEVITQVAADVYPEIPQNSSACIIANDNKNCQSKITHSVSTADPMSHTHLVKLSLPTGMPINAGSFVEVGFAIGKKAGLGIPNSALTVRAGIPGVMVLDEKSKAHFRMVRSVDGGNNTQIIQSGLTQGERIVARDLDAISEGDQILEGGTSAK